MEGCSFIVRLSGDDLSPELKHFTSLERARAFAKGEVPDRADRAEIHLVKIQETRSAINAVRSGESMVIQVIVMESTVAEVGRALNQKWEEIEIRGSQALQKYLLDAFMSIEAKRTGRA